VLGGRSPPVVLRQEIVVPSAVTMTQGLFPLSLAVTALTATCWVVAAAGCPGPEPQLAATGGGGGATGGAGGVVGGSGGGGTSAGGGGAGAAASCDCEQLDVLLVIDNSDAIDDLIPPLAPSLLELASTFEALATRVCSMHLGSVTSRPQPQNPPGCDTQLGALSRVNSGDVPCDFANGRFATEEDDLEDALLCLVNPGTQGLGNERLAEALLAALSPELNAPGACNEGFFRPEAPLLVALISGVEDDDSAGEPATWFADLVALNEDDSSRIASIGMIGPVTAESGCDAEASPRLHAFLGEHGLDNQAALNICGVSTVDLKDGAERMAEAVCPQR